MSNDNIIGGKRKGYVLNEQDAQTIKAMVREFKSRHLNTRNQRDRGTVDHEEILPPEVYIAKTPTDGIPRLVVPTGSSVIDIPGYADCDIYRIVYDDTASTEPYLELLGDGTDDGTIRRRVHNLLTSGVPGNKWILVLRDKFGNWISGYSPPAFFPALLTARELIYGWDSLIPLRSRYAYSWTEMEPTDGGKFQALTGGRSGTHEENPLFELSRQDDFFLTANTPLSSIVWVSEANTHETLGTIYHFSPPNLLFVVQVHTAEGTQHPNDAGTHAGLYNGYVLTPYLTGNVSYILAGSCRIQSLNLGTLVEDRRYLAYHLNGDHYLVYDECPCDEYPITGSSPFPVTCSGGCVYILSGGVWSDGIEYSPPQNCQSDDGLNSYPCHCGDPTALYPPELYPEGYLLYWGDACEPGEDTTGTWEANSGTGSSLCEGSCYWQWMPEEVWQQLTFCPSFSDCSCSEPGTPGEFVGALVQTSCVGGTTGTSSGGDLTGTSGGGEIFP